MNSILVYVVSVRSVCRVGVVTPLCDPGRDLERSLTMRELIY